MFPYIEGIQEAHPGPPTTPTCLMCRAWWARGPTNVYKSYYISKFSYSFISCILVCFIRLFFTYIFVERSNNYEDKPYIKHSRMCDSLSITRTTVSLTLCKPGESRVNQVKVVLNRTRPYLEPNNNRLYSYKNRDCFNLAWLSMSVLYLYILVLHSSLTHNN
jgi:hypothetical protein